MRRLISRLASLEAMATSAHVTRESRDRDLCRYLAAVPAEVLNQELSAFSQAERVELQQMIRENVPGYGEGPNP